MEPKIEPIEQVYSPNYTQYVLPPTPSGSSTDTAPSPSNSDHGKHKTELYNGYYNMDLHNGTNVYPLENTQQNEEVPNYYERNNFYTDAQQLYLAAAHHQNLNEWSQTQLKPTILEPMQNEVTKVSTNTQHTPLTPLSNISDDKSQKKKKGKRSRTKYLSYQILELERGYQESQYLTRLKKMELAKKLHLDEARVKVWYQNRRMKDKKLTLEEKSDIRNRIKQENIVSPPEAPALSEIIPVSVKQEEEKASSSVTNRLLTHSVWSKGYKPMDPVFNRYQPYAQNPYNWNSSPYSPTIQNTSYPITNNYFNQYNAQHSNTGDYYGRSPYQYNTPILSSNIRQEPRCTPEKRPTSQEDFAMNFAIAQEFLAKAIQF